MSEPTNIILSEIYVTTQSRVRYPVRNPGNFGYFRWIHKLYACWHIMIHDQAIVSRFTILGTMRTLERNADDKRD